MNFPRNDGYKQKTSSVCPGDQSSEFWNLPLGEGYTANLTGRQGDPDFTGASRGFQKPRGLPARKSQVCRGPPGLRWLLRRELQGV